MHTQLVSAMPRKATTSYQGKVHVSDFTEIVCIEREMDVDWKPNVRVAYLTWGLEVKWLAETAIKQVSTASCKHVYLKCVHSQCDKDWQAQFRVERE